MSQGQFRGDMIKCLAAKFDYRITVIPVLVSETCGVTKSVLRELKSSHRPYLRKLVGNITYLWVADHSWVEFLFFCFTIPNAGVQLKRNISSTIIVKKSALRRHSATRRKTLRAMVFTISFCIVPDTYLLVFFVVHSARSGKVFRA